MQRKVFCGLALILLLANIFMVTPNVQMPRASGTIYIKADGSVEGTDKIRRSGNVYTFVDNIYDEIIVQKSGIVVDGSDHVLEGTILGTGVTLENIQSVTVKNLQVKTWDCGIRLENCSHCQVLDTYIKLNFESGILLLSSYNISIYGNDISLNKGAGITRDPVPYGGGSQLVAIYANTITNNDFGILLQYGSVNITDNVITDNAKDGIELSSCGDSAVYGNLIANNKFNGISTHEVYGFGDRSVDIVNNTIAENGGVGVYLNYSYRINVNTNNVTNNSGGGISIKGKPGVGMYYNKISNNILNGSRAWQNIDVSSCKENYISGNTVYRGGINLNDYSTNNEIENNRVTEGTIMLWNESGYNDILGNNIDGGGL